ncbi:MAG: ATP-binding cassette domain-containing protein [Flavobacteriales bacterium]|jgi:ABC transporter fused permease/ATP-binding protein|nr:ATP-binding cassette domain-containing protein [Flavobacteriales bacterium]MBK7940481.1 ATP-binding cassette domain-containing protein [Flavobacteriales bacterium]MBK8950220.1 ATP-binding cassette domain-containing protein [Flavobacteriales bacterium]
MASRRDRSRYNDAKPAKLDRATLRKALRLFRYLRPHRWTFAAGLLFLIGTSGLSLVFPGLMGKLIDSSKGETSFSAPLFDLTNTDSIFLLLLLVFAVQAVLGFFRIYLFAHVTEHMLADLRRDTYAHLLRLPMAFFAKRRVGELNSRLSADVALLQDTFTTTLAELLRQLIIIAAGIVLLARLSPELTLTMLASVPVVVLVAVLFGRFIGRLSRQVQDRIADTNVIVDETLQGIQSVKAFANEAWESMRYGRSVLSARALAMRGARWRGALVSFIILCMFGAIILVVWRGVNLQREGLLTNGELVTFIMYSVFVGASIGGIPEHVNTVLKAIGATERLMDLHDEPGEPVSLEARKERIELRGRIAFEDVSFHYATRADVPVLRNVSFAAEPGQRIALVGPSGAGKSTVAALVLRFFDPVQGTVRIDDRDARDYPLTALRDRMAIVPQEVLLFGGSIRENIAYGRPDATDAEVEAAARRANAHDFIAAFPEGYATVVGERGIQLSGGQRQRIAIARAVLKDPAILILDEATSALDSESERLVQEALEQLMRGRTSLVIAHRLSTIRDADRILVLDKGVIAESGTHGELIADADGLYHSLSRLQMES